MDLRPQAHEIIRTWLFSTAVRAELEHGVLPWRHAAISGWILDPERKKMSKSKGNVVTPVDLLDQHGSDAVRYWAVSARPGTDTAFEVGQMKIGRRLAVKVLNASKFVLGFGTGPSAAEVTRPLDQAMLARIAEVVAEATEHLDGYDYARALETIERCFWSFCDHYVELVKNRAYGAMTEADADSARATLTTALSVLLRALAPFLPFTTEEAWSWWRSGSIHRAAWPTPQELQPLAPHGDPRLLTLAAEATTAIRKAKSTAQLSMRAEVKSLVVTGPPTLHNALREVLPDVQAAGRVLDVEFRSAETDTLAYEVVLL